LEPIATRAYVNDPANDLTYPTQRTAFYLQTDIDSGVWMTAAPSTRNQGKRSAADPISPEDMDPWVHRYTADNTSSQTQWHAQKNASRAQLENINEAGMNKAAHALASEAVEGITSER